MVTSLISLKMVSKLIARPNRSQSLRSLTYPLGCETETETRSGIPRNATKAHKVSNQIETLIPEPQAKQFLGS
jgi:hypothetical protein